MQKGYFFIMFPILGFGIAPVLIEIGLQQIDVFTFLFIRFFISSLLLTPLLAFGYWPKIKALLTNKYTYLLGISQITAIVFQYLSQLFVIPSVSTIITKSYLIYVPFLTPFLLKEQFQVKNVGIAVMGFFGVLLILGLEQGLGLGDLILGVSAAIVSSLGFAFYIVFSSKLAQDTEIDNVALLIIILWMVSITSFVLMGINDYQEIPLTKEMVWIFAVLIILSTLVAYFAYFLALETISATTGSVLLLLQNLPPFIVDFAWYRRPLSPLFAVGSILILISSYLSVKLNSNNKTSTIN